MKWISIDERLPPNDIYVLTAWLDTKEKNFDFYSTIIAARYHDDWVDAYNGEKLERKRSVITHWMPLPDDPNKQDKVMNLQE